MNNSNFKLKLVITLLAAGEGILYVILKAALDALSIPAIALAIGGQVLLFFLLFYYIFPKIELSVWYNIYAGIVYIVIFTIAVFLLLEPISLFEIIGTILILVAVMLL